MIKLKHCVKITKENETEFLTFAKAENHEGSYPYNFRIHEGGSFSVGSQYGILECTTFSGFSIWLKRLMNWSPHLRCSVMMLYSDEPDQLQVHTVIIKDIDSLTQVCI